ncbi:MAG: hypothetical protein M1820_008526 [Bogoriella megaspora]|nr:MAG: hypothetical protein M1820_008526 [Bogoriella megaspora]
MALALILNFLLMISLTILALVAGHHAFKIRKFRREEKAHGCQPARKLPQKDPIFGFDLFLQAGKMFAENKFLPVMFERYRTAGQTFETNILGARTVHSCSPANFQSVFAANASTWGVSYRLPALGPYCGRGFLTVDGSEWQHSRAVLAPSFSKNNMSNLADFDHYLQLMIDKIPKDGSTVDIQPLIFSLYLDTSTLFLFGESFESLSGDQTEEALRFIEAAGYSLGGGGLRMALGPLQFLHYDPKWRKSNQLIHELVDRFIKKADNRENGASAKAKRSKGAGRHIVLDSVLQQSDDRTFIRDETTQAFVTLHETTACLISNMFWLMARHPAVWDRLRADVLSMGDIPLDFDSAMTLKYMRNVINETLRYYPVFPYHIRIALKDTTLPEGGGPSGKDPVYMPAGSQFDGNFAVLHREKSIWGPDADEFRPERWNTFMPKRWEFAPFGGGPRSCIGQQKALMETSYFTARMCRNFSRIVPRDDRPWVGQVQVTAKNFNGCHVGMFTA